MRSRAAEAIKLLQRALQISPDDIDATLLLAKALITSRKYGDAKKTLQDLLGRGEDAQAYQLLIRLELGLKNIASAVEIASTAVSAFPQDDKLIVLYRKAQQRLEPEEDPTDIDEPPDVFFGQKPRETPKEAVVQVDLDIGEVTTRKMAREEIAEALVAPDDPTPPIAARVDPEDQPTRNLRNNEDSGSRPTRNLRNNEDSTPEQTPRYGPLLGEGAPNLVGAVERFLAAANPQQPGFTGLLGDGPSIHHRTRQPTPTRTTQPWDDEDLFDLDDDDFEEILSNITESTPAEILTPPISPKARLRLVSSDAVCPLDHPTPSTPGFDSLVGTDPDDIEDRTTAPYPAVRRLTSRDAPQLRTQETAAFAPATETALRALRSVPTPSVPSLESIPSVPSDPVPSDPVPSVPSIALVPPVPSVEPVPPVPSLPTAPEALVPDAPTLQPEHDIPTRVGKTRPPLTTIMVRRRGGRFWLAAGCLGMLAVSVIVLGFMLVRQIQAARRLESARALSRTYQAQHLKTALYHAKEAATLGGRTAEVLALAAAVHSRLTVEFGESDIDATATMIEQSNRLGAPYETAAAEEIAIANAYYMLATKPLPAVNEQLRKATERHPGNVTLARLYAETLIQRGELPLAARVLHQLPADDGGVLRALAELHWLQGQRQTARSYLQAAVLSGLTADQVALFIARLQLRSAKVDPNEIITMRRLAESKHLSRVERGWARLIEVSILVNTDPTSARKTLQQALQHRPIADGEFYFQAARLLQRLGNREQAMKQIETARRTAPSNLQYLTLEAELHLEMDRPTFAIAQLSGLSRDVSGAAVLARAYLRRGELATAREVVRSLPSQAAARRTIESRALIAEAKPHEALRHLSGLSATDETVSLVRGLAELAAGELPAAAAALDVVIFQNPHNAEALWALGQTEIRRANGHKARNYLSRAVAANPHRLRFRLELGRLLIELGDYAKARPQFLAVLAHDPHNLSALAGRAFASVELNHREVAADLFALKSSGHRNMAMLLSMRRWMRIGRWDQASSDLDHVDTRWLSAEHRGQLWRADILQKRGQLKKAKKIYRHLVRYRETRPQARLALSTLSLSADDLSEAIRHARLAKKALIRGIYPAQLEIAVRQQLARCLEQAEAFDEAIDELKNVLARNETDFAANLMLGRIKAEIQEPQDAVKHLARAVHIKGTKPARRLLARVCGQLTERPAQCL